MVTSCPVSRHREGVPSSRCQGVSGSEGALGLLSADGVQADEFLGDPADASFFAGLSAQSAPPILQREARRIPYLEIWSPLSVGTDIWSVATRLRARTDDQVVARGGSRPHARRAWETSR